MDFDIHTCGFDKIKEKLITNVRSFHSPIDSYLEDHILKSQHFEILINLTQIGYFSVFKNNLLTQYYIDKTYRTSGQTIFSSVMRYEKIQKALVPTCDEFFLSHTVDQSKKIETQAYFFQDTQMNIPDDKVIPDFNCKIATNEDISIIKDKSGDFFDNLEQRIKNKEIYIGIIRNHIVSFGIIEKSKLYESFASIGMFTIGDQRQKGIGRNTLLILKRYCYNEGIKPIAGCWYYNHNSKKALESAGMFSHTRLLVIHL